VSAHVLPAKGSGRAKTIRVGIIGVNPGRGWAAQAHIPALKSMPDDFEITALSTRRRASADAAGKLFGVPAAFDDHRELVNSPNVDVVAVTVKVPHHLELATAALDAGKAVYCEWPLGNGLKEAEALAALAKKKGVLAVVGLQARSAPAVAYVRDLIKQGYVGEVLSTTLIGSGMGWGPSVEPGQRVHERQEERRDDARDRARPRGGRALSLPRRAARTLRHHDDAP
jgi:predicted dehydrogenase